MLCTRTPLAARFFIVVFGQLISSTADGVLKFTLEPPNPSYAGNGSNAKLVWDYSVDNPVELQGLIYSVKEPSGAFTEMLVKLADGNVTNHQNIPAAYNGRVKIEGRASLVVENVTLQDNTEFKCALVPNSGKDVQSKVQLIVTAVPKIYRLTVQSSYTEGSAVNISCTAAGTPDPYVQWITNGKVKNSGKKTAFLTFSNINRADDGRYTCRANNSAGNDQNHLTLVVHYKPEGTTLSPNAAGNTVTQGGSVTFTCHVTAAKPQVSRYRFYLNDTLTPIKDGNDNQYTINNVQRSQHYGNYKCVPSNDVGDGPEATVTLDVNVPVQLTVFPQNLTVNETNPVVVSCDASGFPEPSFTWRKDGQVLSQPKELSIQRSVRSNTGMYVCTASNGVGQDKTAKAYVTVQYPPTIKEAGSSAAKSWIGQTVTLKCVSDGVPTPTLTWYKPDGKQINNIKATQNTVDVKMSLDQDFGGYKCVADNGLTPADFKIVKIEEIKKPGSPAIVQLDIQATSLTVKWTAPADDGGSPIKAYRVVILKGSTEIKNINITGPGTTSMSVGDLERDTEYRVKVFTRNAVFEGPAAEKAVKTKYEGVPAAATIDDLPNEVTDDTITLKWREPENNGKEITQYTVYQRIVTDGKPGEWIKRQTITDVSVRELTVELQSGRVYEFVVTVTNEFGESLKEDGKIVRVKASGVPPTTIASKNKVPPTTIASKNKAISKRNRRNVCVGCGGELVPLNTMATETTKQSSSIVPSDDSRTYAAVSSGDYMPLHPSTRSWEINREQVKVLKVIGKGAFSQVAKATAWNISGDEEYSTVAVKMLKANAPDSDRKDLLSELEVMKKLKPHPHVIKLMGCVTESDPLLVVIEYVPYGDLLGYLRKSRGLNDTYFNDPDVKPQTNLTAEQLVKFAWQVADGMFYLSSRKIIHRDLAARNVLVGEGEKCKVTDFGMARNVQQDDIYTKQSRGRLPVKWTSYEALLFGTYTTQSDVWSYGVLLYEILTVGGSPYPGIHARQIAKKLQEGYRMPKPKHVDTKLYQIMLKCWEENPSDRPTFAKLKDTMKEIERNHRTYVNLKQYDNNLYANIEDLTAE